MNRACHQKSAPQFLRATPENVACHIGNRRSALGTDAVRKALKGWRRHDCRFPAFRVELPRADSTSRCTVPLFWPGPGPRRCRLIPGHVIAAPASCPLPCSLAALPAVRTAPDSVTSTKTRAPTELFNQGEAARPPAESLPDTTCWQRPQEPKPQSYRRLERPHQPGQTRSTIRHYQTNPVENHILT
jgi:hypothetical protein